MTLQQRISKAKYSAWLSFNDVWEISFLDFMRSDHTMVKGARDRAVDEARDLHEMDRTGPYRGPMRQSHRDDSGKLWVECSECNRGGNGEDKDKCSCGWQARLPRQLGCYLGALRAGIFERKAA